MTASDRSRVLFCGRERGAAHRWKIQYVTVATTEKIPRGAKLVAKGISGHGSVPLQRNAVVHLAQAVAKVAAWQTPTRLNETTKTFFKRLAGINQPEDAGRYQALLRGNNAESAQAYLAVKEPRAGSKKSLYG